MSIKPKPSDRQPLRLLKWTLWIPALALATGYLWLRHHLAKPKTAAELRRQEKARRKQIRRQLRGLDPLPPAKAA